jgi:hypothetical protein
LGGAWATGTGIRAPSRSGWWASPGSRLSPGFGQHARADYGPPAHGWSAPVTLAGYGAGIALLAVFAPWERRVGEPMLDITLFHNIRFSAASFSITVAFFGLFGFIFLITQYFQLVQWTDTDVGP